MAEPKNVQSGWKFREMTGGKRAAAERRSLEREASDQAFAQREKVKDRTIARENQEVAKSRYCAGHDWVRERQERTGEIERSR